MTLIIYKFNEYTILDNLKDKLFTSNWSLDKEIKLLSAIEKFGLNNWEEFSKLLGKGKFECETHYFTFYYKSKFEFLPTEKIINNNIKNEHKFQDNENSENFYISKIGENMGYIPFSDNKYNNKPLSPLNKDEDISQKEKIEQNIYDSFGYLDKRNDFDIEYEN